MEMLLILWLLCGFVTMAIGKAKGRAAGDSFTLGAVLGIFGLIYVAVSNPPAPDGLQRLSTLTRSGGYQSDQSGTDAVLP